MPVAAVILARTAHLAVVEARLRIVRTVNLRLRSPPRRRRKMVMVWGSTSGTSLTDRSASTARTNRLFTRSIRPAQLATSFSSRTYNISMKFLSISVFCSRRRVTRSSCSML